jgi:hypothetical protein
MLTIEKIDPSSKTQVRRFVTFPFQLYQNDPHWVPPIRLDSEGQLNRAKHPFFEHSDAEFFLATRGKEIVGRVAALENCRYNAYHGTRKGQFYFFECVDDQDVADALLARVCEWAHRRGLETVMGPKGMGPLDGYGLLVEGFEHRQMMTMLNYNPPYYLPLLEKVGFGKEVDFISHYARADQFHLPERIQRIADRVAQRGKLRVQRFQTMRELKTWSKRIGQAYNQAFIHNWEYAPLSEKEVALVVSTLETIADPRLIKLILSEEDVVGFLFAFPDISAAMQRARGRLLPFGLLDMMREMRRTPWLAVNGAGILPEHQGHGGNALLYAEMERTVGTRSFDHAVFCQVAESAVNMRRDLENLGGVPYLNHRVLVKEL